MIDDEKRLVAKWMGWKITETDGTPFYFYRQSGVGKREADWNPHEDPRCWPEIWERLYPQKIGSFLKVLFPLLDMPYGHDEDDKYWACLTAPPEVCWKALIKALEEQNER